jgi:hypothetical protein
VSIVFFGIDMMLLLLLLLSLVLSSSYENDIIVMLVVFVAVLPTTNGTPILHRLNLLHRDPSWWQWWTHAHARRHLVHRWIES